jgi:hypothetical protein
MVVLMCAPLVCTRKRHIVHLQTTIGVKIWRMINLAGGIGATASTPMDAPSTTYPDVIATTIPAILVAIGVVDALTPSQLMWLLKIEGTQHRVPLSRGGTVSLLDGMMKDGNDIIRYCLVAAT